MAIKGFELNSMEAKRYTRRGEKVGNVQIQQNSSVTRIVGTTGDEADIEFRYTTNYGPMGMIKLEGILHFQGDAEDLVRTWTTTNQMPHDVANEVHAAIMRFCIPAAVLLSRDIQLPVPVPIPKVNLPKPGKGGKQQQGSATGFEVA